ncbi:hypothetical protein MTR_2g099760 [Medicago truncatula]|uniref:Uncharacterized protein n=1 Tax=Medicago truncatula TaxID=3880 RepID=G7IS46_MEDTR|nr:hypothetical protein MTR_2g099760 [Medicago truncatula]
MGSGWVLIYPLPVSYPCFGENPYSNPVKTEKPVKLDLVRAGNHGYGFCCHA